MDRIDLHVEVPRPRTSLLAADRQAEESSAVVAKRVAQARARQAKRQGCTNALLEPGQIDQHCGLSSNDRKFLETAAEKLALSPRAIHRVLNVARTIADLHGIATINQEHQAEVPGHRAKKKRQGPRVGPIQFASGEKILPAVTLTPNLSSAT